MPLDPEVQQFLDEVKEKDLPPFHCLDPEVARAGVLADLPNWDPPEPGARIEDSHVPGPAGPIPVRLYTPAVEGPLPVLVYYHGGGWVLCDLSTHDAVCTRLANRAGCLVMSVGYRLAPEHKYPAAAEDAYAVLQWAAAHADRWNGDPARLAVGGDSAGGNLSAVVCQMARDRGGRLPVFQLLIYPVTNHAFDTVSYRENADGRLLTLADMRWFWSHYLAAPEDGAQPYASPLRAHCLSGLPPALVVTAEYDPLRDEGLAYAARLKEAGVAVESLDCKGLIHAFVNRTQRFPKAQEALGVMAAALRRAFGN